MNHVRDSQDVLIEADRLRQHLKKRRAGRRGTLEQIPYRVLSPSPTRIRMKGLI